jgi:PAS domain S-box-containing protein
VKGKQSKLIKLLLVEDNEIDQLAFKRIIAEQDIPYEITICTAVSEARETILEQKFDIIILDYMINEGTSFDIMDAIQDTPFIVYTGAGDEHIAVSAMKKGAYDYIIKDPEHNYLKILPITIQKVLEEKRKNDKIQSLNDMQKAILDSSFDALVVLDHNALLVFANPSFYNLIKYNPNELENNTIDNVLIGKEFIEKLIETSKNKKAIKTLKTTIRPKQGQDIPVIVSICPLVKQNNILLCLRDMRPDESLQQEVKRLRSFLAQYIKLTFYKMGKHGPQVLITEDLTFTTSQKELLLRMGIYYATSLAQGESSIDNTGLFGPFPVPDVPNYVSLTFSFFIDDPNADNRYEGKTYSFITIIIPKTLEQLFSNRQSITNTLSLKIGEISSIFAVTEETLEELKLAILESELS